MERAKRAALLAAVLALGVVLAGCGSTIETVNSSSLYGRVTAVSDDKVTVAVASLPDGLTERQLTADLQKGQTDPLIYTGENCTLTVEAFDLATEEDKDGAQPQAAPETDPDKDDSAAAQNVAPPAAQSTPDTADGAGHTAAARTAASLTVGSYARFDLLTDGSGERTVIAVKILCDDTD